MYPSSTENMVGFGIATIAVIVLVCGLFYTFIRVSRHRRKFMRIVITFTDKNVTSAHLEVRRSDLAKDAANAIVEQFLKDPLSRRNMILPREIAEHARRAQARSKNPIMIFVSYTITDPTCRIVGVDLGDRNIVTHKLGSQEEYYA